MKVINVKEAKSSKAARKNPLLGVDLLRHIFIIAVIFQHMRSEARYSDQLNDEIHAWALFVDGAVAGYFLISGYFFKAPETWMQAVGRMKRLLVPFLAFSLLYAGVLAVLGKMAIEVGLARTFMFAGVGPQLYFLPYLLAISLSWACVINFTEQSLQRVVVGAFLVVCLAAYLALPTPGSTGPNPRLLSLYALTFVWGYYRSHFAGRITLNVVAAFSVIAVLTIPPQDRTWDLALVLLLTEVAIRGSRMIGLYGRFPGSGGVYLLHTPVLNFAVATLLARLGIDAMPNVLLSVAATYGIALGLTWMAITAVPPLRPYLLE